MEHTEHTSHILSVTLSVTLSVKIISIILGGVAAFSALDMALRICSFGLAVVGIAFTYIIHEEKLSKRLKQWWRVVRSKMPF